MSIKNKLIALMLAAVMLASALPIGALAAAEEPDALAYGKADSSYAVTVRPSQLLAMLSGQTPSDAERDYLDRYCDRILEYYDRIPADRIAQYSRGDVLEITAKPFSYTAENGATVLWIPREVVYAGSATVAMTENAEGDFVAEIEGVTPETGNRIGVVYGCEISIPTRIVNELSSLAYQDAMAARDLMTTAEYTAAYAEARAAYDAYLRAMDEYADATVRYEQYLRDCEEYEAERVKYDEYLGKKAAYDVAKAAYDTYLGELAAYDAAKAEYDRVYQENIAGYEAYVAYLANLNRIRASTYAMESLFEEPGSNKTGTLYRALQNAELVSMFERYRDELITLYGISSDTLTHLRTTSDTLNAMLGEYAAAREQSEEAAFLYYKEHYAELSYLFNYLYDNMREVVKGKIFNHICTKIELEYGKGTEMTSYKKWRIKNVLAHIYLICQALDDTKTSDGTFAFYDDNGSKQSYYFSTFLDQNLILTDNNCANPESLSWMPAVEPVVLPTAPVAPTPVPEPVPPTAVTQPTEPAVIRQPTEPARVEEPREATAEELSQYAFADRAAAIVEALETGALSARPTVSEPKPLALTTTVNCQIFFGNGHIVTFYGANGEILSAEELADGESFSVPSVPASLEDAQYHYDYVGFSTTPEGEPVEIPETVQGADLVFYAVYTKTLRQYKITFDFGNGTPPLERMLDYGTLPTLPPSPTRDATETTVYTFLGWSPTVTTVKGDATYEARWQESERLYSVTWHTPSGDVVRRERYGAMPAAPSVPSVYYEGCVRYDFLGFSPTPAAVWEDVTYTAQYRESVLAAAEDETLTVNASLGEYTLTGAGVRTEVGGLLAVAEAEQRRITMRFPTMTVQLDPDAVKSLAQREVAYAEMLRDAAGGVGIGFYAADGRAVRVSGGVIHLSFACEPMAGATLCVLAQDTAGNEFLATGSCEDGVLSVAATPNRTYRAAYRFSLTVAGEGGTVLASAEQYFPGERVEIKSYPDLHHVLSTITLTNNLTGDRTILSSLSELVMPAYPATLSVVFAKQTYRVTFLSRGVVISETEYVPGDIVTIPEIETDFEEDGYRYTFIGWSSPIETVTGDATYEAKFLVVPIEEVPENPTGEAWATGTAIRQVGIPVILVLSAVVAGMTFLVIAVVRRARGKKPSKHKEKPQKKK